MARRKSNSMTFQVSLDKLSHELRQIMLEEGMDILGDLSEKIVKEARQIAPQIDPTVWQSSKAKEKRRTGSKKGPIASEIFFMRSPRVPASWLVISPAWYSHFVEYGTQPHERPRAAWQEAIKMGDEEHIMQFKTNTGHWARYDWLFHSGYVPKKPFMRPAIDKAEQFLHEVLKERYNI